jgi:hypothetical protein
MSLQDEIDFCEYDCLKDEFLDFSNEFEKSMEEIDNLLKEISAYKKVNEVNENSSYKKGDKVKQVNKIKQIDYIDELLPFFILLCYQLNNNDDKNILLLLNQEDRIIHNKENIDNQLIVYNKYYYSNTNIYFGYLDMIDYYVKYIIRECC